MQEISLNGTLFKLPESWHDVVAIDPDRKKIPELLRHIYVESESGETYHNVLRIVLGYTTKEWGKLMNQFFGRKRSVENMDASSKVMAELLRHLSWMWKGELTVAPFKKIVIHGKDWYLFQEGFLSMTFGELADAYINAQVFIKQLIEGEERLDRLFTTICRPERERPYEDDPKWNGDRREDYNEHLAKIRSELVKGGYTAEKVTVLVYFLGTVKEFFSYFDLFDDDGSSPPIKEDFPGQSMIKNQHLLSEKGIFGNMKETKSANVHDVFQFLEEHRKDVKAEIARNKEANKK
jgi:hypothetical protein